MSANADIANVVKKQKGNVLFPEKIHQECGIFPFDGNNIGNIHKFVWHKGAELHQCDVFLLSDVTLHAIGTQFRFLDFVQFGQVSLCYVILDLLKITLAETGFVKTHAASAGLVYVPEKFFYKTFFTH